MKQLDQFSTDITLGLLSEAYYHSICSNHSASLNKMAAMPIYGEHLKIFFSRTKKASWLNTITEHWGLSIIQVCSNDDPRLTFDLFFYLPLPLGYIHV